MSEAELFAAYRNATGWETECDCGDTIYSQLGSAPAGIEEAVRLHQESAVHSQWRSWQEAVHALQRPAPEEVPLPRALGMRILGPAPCQGCRRPVYWDGWEWKRPADSKRHVCVQPNARSARMRRAGTSGQPVDSHPTPCSLLVPERAASLRSEGRD